MPTRRSIEDIPTGGSRPSFPPAREPKIVGHVAELWFAKHLAAGTDYAPAIPGTKYRMSNAGIRCDRAQYYALTATEKSNPPGIADMWRMNAGSMIHEALGSTLAELGHGWRTEVIVDARPLIDGSGHADLVQFVCIHCGAHIEHVEILQQYSDGAELHSMQCSAGCAQGDPFTIKRTGAGEHTWAPGFERAAYVCEFKTINGYGFKMSATNQAGPPEGPKFGHIVQGALAAHALDCAKLIIAYMSLENVSPGLAAAYGTGEIGRFTAEWHYRMADLAPIIDAEVARIQRLQRCADAGLMPLTELHDPSSFPPGAFVSDPKDGRTKGLWITRDPDTGATVSFGEAWNCQYCDWRDRCRADGPEAATTDVEP